MVHKLLCCWLDVMFLGCFFFFFYYGCVCLVKVEKNSWLRYMFIVTLIAGHLYWLLKGEGLITFLKNYVVTMVIGILNERAYNVQKLLYQWILNCVWSQSVNFLIKKKTFCVIIKSKFYHAPRHPLVCVSCQTHETLNKVSVLERHFKKCFLMEPINRGLNR